MGVAAGAEFVPVRAGVVEARNVEFGGAFAAGVGFPFSFAFFRGDALLVESAGAAAGGFWCFLRRAAEAWEFLSWLVTGECPAAEVDVVVIVFALAFHAAADFGSGEAGAVGAAGDWALPWSDAGVGGWWRWEGAVVSCLGWSVS